MSLLNGLIWFFLFFDYIPSVKWSLHHYLTASSISLIYTERKAAVMSLRNGLIWFSYIFGTKSGLSSGKDLLMTSYQCGTRTETKLKNLSWSQTAQFHPQFHANRVPRYLFNYFNVRNHDIPCYKTTSSNGLILEKVNLECTKSAFFCNYF